MFLAILRYYVISRSINAWDIKVSILFNLLLAWLKEFYYASFFYFLSLLRLFYYSCCQKKARVKFALAIPAGTPKTLAKKVIDTPPLVADKTIKSLLI